MLVEYTKQFSSRITKLIHLKNRLSNETIGRLKDKVISKKSISSDNVNVSRKPYHLNPYELKRKTISDKNAINDNINRFNNNTTGTNLSRIAEPVKLVARNPISAITVPTPIPTIPVAIPAENLIKSKVKPYKVLTDGLSKGVDVASKYAIEKPVDYITKGKKGLFGVKIPTIPSGSRRNK